MTPAALARTLQEFLSTAPNGVMIEDGQILFELGSSQFSISVDKDRCLLHMWSQERNLVRNVIDAESKKDALILSVRRFAQARPHKLEICRDRDRRPPSVQKAARNLYARTLERALRRQLPEWALDKSKLSTTMDLERSFSPVYARGLARKGRSTFAVLGLGREETQAAVDAALTFGLIWLQACRESEAGHSVVEGLQLYVPPRSSSTLQMRLPHLDHNAARFQLFEFDERDESVNPVDFTDQGNIDTRLVRCADSEQVRSRFSGIVGKILAMAPQADLAPLSPTQLSFRLHGLEFARARLSIVPGHFNIEEEVMFGPPGYETRLNAETEPAFQQFISTVVEARDTEGNRNDPLWRMYPERWLESLIFKNVASVDSQLDPAHVYSQVPAFSASDRAMIDVLTCSRSGRIAVLELKADEDIHLPLQGLDYWARVQWHHSRGEFQQFGYFAGTQLSPRSPLLYLVAPSLRVHPATDTVLRYFSPAIDWTLVGLDERWRDDVQVVYRKQAKSQAAL